MTKLLTLKGQERNQYAEDITKIAMKKKKVSYLFFPLLFSLLFGKF